MSSSKNIVSSFFNKFSFYIKELIKKLKSKDELRFFDNSDNNKCCFDIEYRSRVVKTLVNNWLIAKLIGEENGGKFFAVLQPSSFTGNNIFHENYEMTRSDCTKDIYNKMCEMI